MDVFPRRELKRFGSIPDGELFQMRVAGKLIFAINTTKEGVGETTSKVTILLQDFQAKEPRPALCYVEFKIEDQWVISYGSDYVFRSDLKSGVVDLSGTNDAERSGALILREAGPALRISPVSGTHHWHHIDYDIQTKTITKHTDIYDIAVIRPFSLCLRDPFNGKLEELLTFT
jgi:hypothetical protein